jgi:RNA polymerase sigma-70 factor (ECF subfamily)
MPHTHKLNTAIQTLAGFASEQGCALNAVAQSAARVLYDHYWPRFVRFFCRNSKSEAVAQELANDALLKIMSNAHKLNAVQALEKWAWMIARNTLYDHSRQQTSLLKSETLVDEDTWFALMETLPTDNEGDPLVSRCLQQQFDLFVQAHPDHAECIEHLVLNSADTDDLAHLLGRTAAATREFLSQSRKKLKDFLRRCLE